MQNGIYLNWGDLGIFPPVNPSEHLKNETYSKLAVQYFTKCLRKQPDNLEVKWLLNLAYVTLGGYLSQGSREIPRSVERFPIQKRASDAFANAALAAGLNVFTSAGGVVVEDFDNDGLLDVNDLPVWICANRCISSITN